MNEIGYELVIHIARWLRYVLVHFRYIEQFSSRSIAFVHLGNNFGLLNYLISLNYLT